MIGAWMLRMLAASLLIGLASWLLERGFRAFGGPLRWAWAAGLAAVLAAPLAALLLPALVPIGVAGAGMIDVGRILLNGPVDVAADGVGSSGVTVGPVLAGFWVAAVVMALTVYAAGWWRLRRARRAWRRGRVAGASVLVSPGAGPAAVGVLQPAIVVPEWLLVEDESVQRLVVLHEAEHLAAGDHLMLAMAPLVVVLMPWNPVLWWMLRRLRLAIELDCDRRVLARGVEASAYGTLLLDVAGRRGVGTFSMALASPRSALERRIEALATSVRGGGRARLAGFAAVALICVLLACGVAPTAPIDRVAATLDGPVDGTRAAELVRRFGSEGTRWTIDGRPATVAAVLALAPDEFAMIRVEEARTAHSDGGAGESVSSSVVHIATPHHVASNPDLFDPALHSRGPERLSPLERIRSLLNDPDLHVVIDGRETDRRELESLAESDIARLEIVRQRIGDDVTAGIRIRTSAAFPD